MCNDSFRNSVRLTDLFWHFQTSLFLWLEATKDLEIFQIIYKKKLIDAAIFNCLMTSSKISFFSANYTPVTLPTQ